MNHPDYKHNPQKFYKVLTSEERVAIHRQLETRVRIAMNLYMDDDSVGGLRVKSLREAGHDILLPADIGAAGEEDPEHFMHAIRRSRVLFTYNYRDFELLHDLVLLVGGHHPGILVVRRDNDQKRDMKPHDIVRAIKNLLGSGIQVADGYHLLNSYR